MRPRVFPAEDEGTAAVTDLTEVASMRPRVFPAEDARLQLRGHQHGQASMRPRVFPAEDAKRICITPIRSALQ